jgi:biofilm PGA synthesis lipoprotein PgaB
MKLTPAILLFTTGLLALGPASANASAYILLYHHIDDTTPAPTSISPELFAEHMEFIANNGYKVVPLTKLMSTVRKGGKIRPRTVAITFDDAYPSILHNALPILQHHKWPFTVFASTADIDRNSDSYLSWDELRELESHRGTIANHGHQHQHMLNRQLQESDDEWQSRITGDIEFAQTRLEAELKKPAKLFSYPYGEFDAELVQLVRELGYLAVGQQSGPVGPDSSPYAVPRFPQGAGYSDMARLREKLNTLSFHVLSPTLPATVLAPDEDRPTLDLQFTAGAYRASQLTCFASGQGTARTRWQDSGSTQAKVTARETLPPGRTNYTCTAPHQSVPELFYWYTHLFMKPLPDGSWYEN